MAGEHEADLTRRQREILALLRDHAANGEHAPTLGELCTALGLRSRGSLHKHITALVEMGFVVPPKGRRRGIRLTERAASEAGHLPFLGRIAAGRPIEAIAQPETIAVPEALRTPAPCYVLEVRGESMINEGILDGDWVVIESRSQARNGEVVVALIDGEEATLKRIERRAGEIILHPANADMAPLRFSPERVEVQGVLVGQMRRYWPTFSV